MVVFGHDRVGSITYHGCATATVGAMPANERAPGRVPSVTLPLGRPDSGSRRRAGRSRRA